MKSVLKTLVLAFAAALILDPVMAIAGPEQRQARQAERIQQGSQSGQLTQHEQRQLVRQQQRIQDTRQDARADGEVTKQERRRIATQQHHASQNIYRLKHNNRTQDSHTGKAHGHDK